MCVIIKPGTLFAKKDFLVYKLVRITQDGEFISFMPPFLAFRS